MLASQPGADTFLVRHAPQCPVTNLNNLRPNHSLVWALNGFQGVLFTTTKTNGPKKGQNIDCHKMECQTESTYCRPLLRARPPGRQTLTQTSGVAAALTWAGISPPGAMSPSIAICQIIFTVESILQLLLTSHSLPHGSESESESDDINHTIFAVCCI